MYPVSQTFITEATSQTRDVYAKIVLEAKADGNPDTTVTLDGEDIIEFSVDYPFDDNNRPVFGSALSASANITIKNPNLAVYFGRGTVTAKPYVGFPDAIDADGNVTSVEYMPLGVFKTYEVRSTDNFNTIEITAYDAISQMDAPYSWAATDPIGKPIAELASEIAQQYDLTLDPNVVFPTDYYGGVIRVKPLTDGDGNDVVNTARDWLGWIAGFLCSNAIIDKNGLLTFKKYENHVDTTITEHDQWLGGYQREREDYIYYQGARLTLDDGTALGITPNFYRTAIFGNAPKSVWSGSYQTYFNITLRQELTALFSNGKNTYYPFMPGTLNYRGMPYIECGDIVLITVGGVTKRIMVSHQSLKVSGGLSGEIQCYGVTSLDETLNSYSSPSYSGGGGGVSYTGGNGISVNGGVIKIKDFLIIDSGTSTTVIEE